MVYQLTLVCKRSAHTFEQATPDAHDGPSRPQLHAEQVVDVPDGKTEGEDKDTNGKSPGDDSASGVPLGESADEQRIAHDRRQQDGAKSNLVVDWIWHVQAIPVNMLGKMAVRDSLRGGDSKTPGQDSQRSPNTPSKLKAFLGVEDKIRGV